MKKRISSIFLTIILITGLFPTVSFADTPIKVLALGDSITAGYGLTNIETERFTALFGNNYIVTNKAVNGNTLASIAKQLKTDMINTKMITDADVITITVGGNDMMSLIYGKMADVYNTKNNSNIASADIMKIIDDLNQSNLLQNYALLSIEAQLLSKENINYFINSQEFSTALDSYQKMLVKTTTSLKKINPNAKIIVATQYNPYAEFANNPLFKPIYEGIEEGMSRLNETIITSATAGGYTVADVKTAFENKHSNKNDLYNANPNISSIDLDFHPTANGHIVLAEVFKTAIEESYNNNETTNSNTWTFNDISSNDYYAEAINWATENGIAYGTSPTTFSPASSCTRAQITTFLWRAAGSPTPKITKMPFSDVPADSYYYKAILWATENGITAGTSKTTFSPNAECTRAQVTTLLWRTQKAPVLSGANPFNDVATDSYYSNAILWAINKNITSGTSDTTFSPDEICTRAQIVTFLWRYLNNY